MWGVSWSETRPGCIKAALMSMKETLLMRGIAVRKGLFDATGRAVGPAGVNQVIAGQRDVPASN